MSIQVQKACTYLGLGERSIPLPAEVDEVVQLQAECAGGRCCAQERQLQVKPTNMLVSSRCRMAQTEWFGPQTPNKNCWGGRKVSSNYATHP